MNGQTKTPDALSQVHEKPSYPAQHMLPEVPHITGQDNDAVSREQADLGRLLLEYSDELISMLDHTGHFVFVSPQAEAALGYPSETLVEQLAFNLLHPDDFATVLERWMALEQDERGQVICRLRHAEGSWRWFEVRAARVTWRGMPAVLSTGHDITERMQLESSLVHMQKIDSLGQIAGSVAHDFNNMLTAILGYAEMGLRDLEDGEVLDNMADLLIEIQKAATRAAGLTRQVLAFSRRQTVAPRLLHLNRVLRDLDTLLRSLAGHNIELITQLDERLGIIRGDEGQLEQIVLNLVTNARDSMPHGGQLQIETTNIQLDAPLNQLPAGGYVLLTIRDTGSGIDAPVLERIFEPFFTTKEPGQGTGMGLATCQSIIKQHGGTIVVTSALGEGTTVEVYLPRIGAVMIPDDIEAAPTDLPRGSERLLLVEDEAVVRALTAQLLRNLGYSVRVASNGAEALEMMAKAAPDLLIVDVMIPQIDGVSLAIQASARAPQIKVLLMSGYHASVVHQFGHQLDSYHFLQKPFSPLVLAQAVYNALHTAPTLQAQAV